MANRFSILAPSEELVRGQSVKVPIHLSLESPLKARGIAAVFRGVEETKATYTTSDGKDTQTHTAVEQTEFVKQPTQLAGRPSPGFLGGLGEAIAGGETIELEPGEHPFEIELSVPADAPASHEGQRSRVFYELKVAADIPLGFDLKAIQPFHVAREAKAELNPTPLLLTYPDEKGRGFWDKLFAPDVTMKVGLASNVLTRGEIVEGMVQVESAKPLKYRGFKVRLVGVEQSTAQGHQDSHTYWGEVLQEQPQVTGATMFNHAFSLPANADGPPTSEGKLFKIEWFVELALDVPWARDPKIRLPVTLID